MSGGGWVQWVSTCNSVPFPGGGGGRMDCFGAVNVAISWSKRLRILHSNFVEKKRGFAPMGKHRVFGTVYFCRGRTRTGFCSGGCAGRQPGDAYFN